MPLRVLDPVDSLITPATGLPFDVAWAKTHLKSLTDDEDLLVESWTRAAMQYFEELTGRQVLEATWETWFDAFPVERRIELPHPPLRSVLSVKYLDSDGNEVPFSDGASPETVSWQSRAPQGPHARRGWVELKPTLSWPIARSDSGAVRVRYTAGYGTTDSDVPDEVKTVLLLLVGHFEQFRSEVHLSEGSARLEQLPFGVQQMVRGFLYTAMPSQVLTYQATV